MANKITREQDAVAILGVMVAFGNSNDLIWTPMIYSELLRLSVDRVNDVLGMLLDAGYMSIHQGSYLITDDGRDHYASVCRRPEYEDSKRWKDEALSGIDSDGRQTKISDAVLPTATSRPPPNQPLEISIRPECELAALLSLSADEIVRRLKDGSLHVCNGGGKPHPGIFHRNNSRYNGWQALCRRCHNEIRRHKRSREKAESHAG